MTTEHGEDGTGDADVLDVDPATGDLITARQRDDGGPAGVPPPGTAATPAATAAPPPSGGAVVSPWRQLADWVAWLVSTYELAELIPPCWTQHPAAAEELAALRTSRIAAESGEDSDALLRWHERLGPAIARVHGHAASCRLDTHEPPAELDPRWQSDGPADPAVPPTAKSG